MANGQHTTPLHIDAPTALGSVTYGQAIEALRSQLRAGFDPESDGVRTRAPLSRGDFLFMPSEAGAYAGVKVITSTPGNPERGFPLVQGLFLLLDSQTHELLASVDGAALTNLRTPAITLAGVAGPLLGRFGGGVNLTVFGNGNQALPHIKAVQALVPIDELTVVVRSAGKADGVIAGARELGIDAAEVLTGSEQAQAAVARSGLVLTLTASSQPLFPAEWVSHGAIVAAVGAHTPDARELPGELLGRAQVVVEAMGSAQRECGDVIQAIDEGFLGWDEVMTIREVENGKPLDSSRTLVFKCVGMPWEDLTVGALVYEQVR